MGSCVMNERIQELWDKATFDESRIVDGVYHPYIALQFMGEPGRYSITDEQKAKFAKLIVQECVNCCDEVDRLNKAFIKCYDFDPQHGPKECIQQILEHFGVEE